MCWHFAFYSLHAVTAVPLPIHLPGRLGGEEIERTSYDRMERMQGDKRVIMLIAGRAVSNYIIRGEHRQGLSKILGNDMLYTY